MSLLGTLALTPLELVLARLIAHDPHTAKRIEAFDGKLIEILVELTNTPNAGSVSLCLVFRGQRVKLNLASSAALMQTPDAVLEGSASALLDLLAQPAQKRALSNPALTVSGDADLIQALYHFVSSLDLRWDDYLAPFLGTVATNEIARVSKEAGDWRRESRTAMTQTLDDYLVEEIKVVPARFEAQELSDGIDALRLRIDRLEARLRAAENK